MERPVMPMSWDEYEVLEHPFGWKVEYWDGHAHLTPRSIGVRTQITLSPRNLHHQHHLIPAHSDYREQMMAGYCEAFGDSVEFCGCSPEYVRQSAEQDLTRYFAEQRGEPLSASVIALEPDAQKLAGLALFILKPEQGAYMDLLFVRPDFQGQGMGTAMLAWGIDRLIAANLPCLTSTYHICNKKSQLWHHRQGFQDVYDAHYVRLKVRWYDNEIWRREKLGLSEGLDVFRQERTHWEAQVHPDDLY
jgi:GNAT superfamily N-acetyltransferase